MYDQALSAHSHLQITLLLQMLQTSGSTEITSDTPDQTTPLEDSLGAQVSNQTDACCSSAVAGVTASNSNVENNHIITFKTSLMISHLAVLKAEEILKTLHNKFLKKLSQTPEVK